MIRYRSTRGGERGVGFAEVLLSGLARDGGLYVPERWPRWSRQELRGLEGCDYAATAAALLAPFTAGCFARDELSALCREAYRGFAHPAVAPLVQIGPDEWLLELFHGPTLAFKDFALQLLGRLFDRLLARRDLGVTVIGATSGDTGSAALHALAGLPRIRAVILHPHERISPLQRRQMTTLTASNVTNIAIRGTFDDCQALVKAMFRDQPFRARHRLAAVNSINWARIAAQIPYYVYAALRLGAPRRPIAFVVPTGNFGNIYAAYAAARIGLPLAGLVLATNDNDILARFFASGRYERGSVRPTLSPSMDIQVASNFERLLFDLMGRDGRRVARLMEGFATTGRIAVPERVLARARAHFRSGRASEQRTLDAIRRLYEESGVIVDPHTAVGLAVARELDGELPRPLVHVATAHPAKFEEAILRAIGRSPEKPTALVRLERLEERFLVLDNDLEAVKRAVAEAAEGGS